MADANTLTCAQCAAPFPAPSTRRGKVQIYCAKDCQTKAANARRQTTRAGRKGATIETNPRPSSPTPPELPATVDRSVSDRQDTPNNRLKALLDKAHSRGGVNAFEIATIAKLRGISPWAPVAKILAR
jgi:hypothetical protein